VGLIEVVLGHRVPHGSQHRQRRINAKQLHETDRGIGPGDSLIHSEEVAVLNEVSGGLGQVAELRRQVGLAPVVSLPLLDRVHTHVLLAFYLVGVDK
jgi:hypothetical protein